MSEKIKNGPKLFLQLIKSALLGVVVSILLVLALAFVLKFINLSNGMVRVVDEIIKIVSLLIATIHLVKKSPYKIFFKGICLGIMYTALTFCVFSIMKGGISFSLSALIDIILGGVTGCAIAVILNIFFGEKLAQKVAK